MQWALRHALAFVVLALGLALAAGVFAACSSSCDSCSKDGGSDGTLSDVGSGGDASGNQCTCPAADAALFNPNGTTCCAGSSCVALHTDGFNHAFYDCYGVQQWAAGLALDACNTYFDAGGGCSVSTCGSLEVATGTTTACVTWVYQGADPSAWGHVRKSAGMMCECPDAGDPAWF